jgi:N-acetylglutamate synthase-like GNAT family acetyltransferase
MTLDIRLARADDRQDLIELLWRASLSWDAVRQDLLDHPEVIDVDPEMIARNQVFVAEDAGRIVGFATIIPRKGVGTALLVQIEREGRAWGANRLHVLASANAEAFYAAAGFTKTGEQATALGPNALVMVKPLL